eukprot:c37390_g1_i1 orf=324-563(+)
MNFKHIEASLRAATTMKEGTGLHRKKPDRDQIQAHGSLCTQKKIMWKTTLHERRTLNFTENPDQDQIQAHGSLCARKNR